MSSEKRMNTEAIARMCQAADFAVTMKLLEDIKSVMPKCNPFEALAAFTLAAR